MSACESAQSSVQVQPSKDCVQKTLKRLEEKIQGRVLKQVLYALNSTDPLMQQRTATALARLLKGEQVRLQDSSAWIQWIWVHSICLHVVVLHTECTPGSQCIRV